MANNTINLFDKIVDEALSESPDYRLIRPVVEKEILHHDILRVMNKEGYLKDLTFIGGTCLRACYGSSRLSEDLDFTGGFGFNRNDLAEMGRTLKDALERKYEAPVSVTEPHRESGNTDSWKIKLTSHPERPDLPAQHIDIDICQLPSYERQPTILKNFYNIDLGTSGLLFYAESLKEILADKILAFATRRNRVKNRDLWDIFWLSSRNIQFSKDMLLKKIADRKVTFADFRQQYVQRLEAIRQGQSAFLQEMRRFLVPSAFTPDFTGQDWWIYLLNLLKEYIEFVRF
jgi:predicted nucleotidyltransferase component of viral defense system